MASPQQFQRRSGYESDQSSDTANDDEYSIQSANFPAVPSSGMPPMWQSQRQQSGSAVSRLSQKFGHNVHIAEIQPPPALHLQNQHQQEHAESSPDDETRSRSSTLGGDEHDYEYPEKTPTSLPRKMAHIMEEDAQPHVPGPLEQQLASLMSKLVFMERENPVVSVTPDDYKELSGRVKKLEEEKKTWQKRHEALYALRDEDVENNIKIRGMLAKARRELEGMTKLRDDDLVNLQAVRYKLAEATRRLDKMETQSGSGRSSPARRSMMLERRDTTDLFAVAKSAALEQRVLELERRNADLLARVQGEPKTLPNGTTSNVDSLNSLTAHKAWKETVADLELKVKEKDALISRMKAGGSPYVGTPKSGVERVHPAAMSSTSGNGAPVWHRVEALHDEHAAYREKMGSKMQLLRSEKEGLQKELNRKEDECHALEIKVQNLQRRAGIAA